MSVGRYHSLAVEFDEGCAPHLMMTARSEEGEIVGISHSYQPTHGVQFHPESTLTEQGQALLVNFGRLVKNRETWESGTQRPR